MQGRIEHCEWTCPWCDARGWCPECGGLGTRDAYNAVQELHSHAIKHPDGIGAQALERIECAAGQEGWGSRYHYIDRVIQHSLRQIGALQ
jgi:hypothetical protein